MQKLIAFNQVSLDGYFVDAKGDMSWAHRQDPEWNDFAASECQWWWRVAIRQGDLRDDGKLLAEFSGDPNHAGGGARYESGTKGRVLEDPGKGGLENTELVTGDIAARVRHMKNEPGAGVAILGSGTIVSQLAEEGLIDEFQIVVVPVALGAGRTLFQGIREKTGFQTDEDTCVWQRQRVALLRTQPAVVMLWRGLPMRGGRGSFRGCRAICA